MYDDPKKACNNIRYDHTDSSDDTKMKSATKAICNIQSVYFGVASILICAQVNKAENMSNFFILNNLSKNYFFLDYFGCFVRILFHRKQSKRPETPNYIF